MLRLSHGGSCAHTPLLGRGRGDQAGSSPGALRGRDEPAAGSFEGGHGPASARASPARRSARPGIGSATRARTRTWTRRPETVIVARLRGRFGAPARRRPWVDAALEERRARRPRRPRRPARRRRGRRGSSAPPARSRATSGSKPRSSTEAWPRTPALRAPEVGGASMSGAPVMRPAAGSGRSRRRGRARAPGGSRDADRDADVAVGARAVTTQAALEPARGDGCGRRPRASSAEGVGARRRAGRDARLPGRLAGEQRLDGGREHARGSPAAGRRTRRRPGRARRAGDARRARERVPARAQTPGGDARRLPGRRATAGGRCRWGGAAGDAAGSRGASRRRERNRAGAAGGVAGGAWPHLCATR